MVNPQRGVGRVLLIVPGFKFQGVAPAATQGVAYSFTPSTTGGTPPYTYSVVTGSIPAWASLNTSTGAVTGANPNVLATTTFTLRVTDSSSPPQTRDLPVSITVSAPLVLTNSPTLTANVSSSYTYTPTTTGGRAPITWAITNKPSWASFNTSTGALTGTTPSSAETDTGIVITGSDADSRTVTTGAFTITVSASTAPILGAPGLPAEPTRTPFTLV